MEDLRLMQAKMRQRELIAEARIARLTASRLLSSRDRFEHSADASHHLAPIQGVDLWPHPTLLRTFRRFDASAFRAEG